MMRVLLALVWGSFLLTAQNWEAGVMGGGGFDINRPSISGRITSVNSR